MKIIATIVTYNRKELLEECIQAILSQTQEVYKVIIVDNKSTDGTIDMLDTKYNNNEKIEIVKLAKNIGGAGGFYSGIKEAQKYNPDWVWIMDDDTIPTSSCLEELCNASSKIKGKISFLASSVYGIQKEFMNVPTINLAKDLNGYHNWYEYLDEGMVKIETATFVSLLINEDAIKKVGFPVKDYFIWGDDTEYTLRLNKYYGNAYMVGKSIAIHKRKISKSLKLREEDNLNRIKFYYYMIRNNLINQKNYFGRKKMIEYFVKNQLISFKILFYPKCKYRFKKFYIIHKALFAYVFRKYDYKAFKNRLDINVKYEEI